MVEPGLKHFRNEANKIRQLKSIYTEIKWNKDTNINIIKKKINKKLAIKIVCWNY